MRAGIRRLNAAQGTINDIARRNEDGAVLAHRRWPPFQLRVKPQSGRLGSARFPGYAVAGVGGRGRGIHFLSPW
jgi:hypothetical protein